MNDEPTKPVDSPTRVVIKSTLDEAMTRPTGPATVDVTPALLVTELEVMKRTSMLARLRGRKRQPVRKKRPNHDKLQAPPIMERPEGMSRQLWRKKYRDACQAAGVPWDRRQVKK